MSSTGIQIQEVYVVPNAALSTDDRINVVGGRSTTSNVPLAVSSSGVLKTTVRGSSILYCNSYSVTSTAGAIASSQTMQEVIVQADPDNTEDVFVGNDTNQTIQLLAGQSMTIPVDNISSIYAKTNQNTATLNYIGRGA